MSKIERDDVSELVAHAKPMTFPAGRWVVPEPFVKAFLRKVGVCVPTGVLLREDTAPATAVAGLRPPLVLKAYGADIIHKSELGAVRLHLSPADLAGAVADMGARLGSRKIVPAGYLVEEQQPGGVELILGSTVGPSGIVSVILGMGGIYVELLQSFATRVFPLTPESAADLVDSFPGASAVLKGFRGSPPIDRSALIAAILAIAGEGGVIDRVLPWGLLEFECNPLIASATGVAVADVRLILGPAQQTVAEVPRADFEKLFEPKSIAVAGASRRGGFGVANRTLATYRAIGWTDNLYVLHPTESQIDGVPAFKSVKEMPGQYVDYLKVVVPAPAVEMVLRENAGSVGIVQVVSGGFGEMGEDGRTLERALLQTARQQGVRFIGPNCIGAYCPSGRQAFRPGDPMELGTVGLVSQSGGLAADLIGTGVSRGVRFSKVLAAGNVLDVSVAEVLEYLVQDSATKVIGLYLESLRDGPRLTAALRAAQGLKPVVILMGGMTAAGAQTAISHTGSLTNESHLLRAVCQSTGAIQVETIEQLTGAMLILQEYSSVASSVPASLLVLGSGGGACTLAADAAERAGLPLTQLSPRTKEHLGKINMGIPKVLGNPLEVVIISPGEIRTTAQKVLAEVRGLQAFSDVLIHINLSPFYAYGKENVSVQPIVEVLTSFAKMARDPWRMTFVTRNADVAPAQDLESIKEACIQLKLPLYRTMGEAMSAIAAVQAFSSTSQRRDTSIPTPVAEHRARASVC